MTYDGRQGILKIGSYLETAGSYGDGAAYTLQKAAVRADGRGWQDPGSAGPHVGARRAAPGRHGAAGSGPRKAPWPPWPAASASDPDGAVGKLQIITDPLDANVKRVGRFGWRGTSATVLQQASSAANSDMGVTTSMYPTHFSAAWPRTAPPAAPPTSRAPS